MPNQKLTYALQTLITLQIFIGIMAIIFGEYYKQTIIGTSSSSALTANDDELLQSKFMLIQFYGFHICIIYSSGIPLVRNYLHNSYTKHLAALLLWNFITFITSIDGFIINWIIKWNINNDYSNFIEQSLYETIEDYQSDAKYRQKWDNLQLNNHCCGVNKFNDWTDVDIVETIISTNNSKFKPNLIPFSCCRQSMDCYEKHIIQSSSTIWLEIQNVNITAIYQNGCLVSIINRIENAKIFTVILIVAVFILQLCILFFMRYIFMEKHILTNQVSKHSQTELPTGIPIIGDNLTNDTDDSVQVLYEFNKNNEHVEKRNCRKFRNKHVDKKFASESEELLLKQY